MTLIVAGVRAAPEIGIAVDSMNCEIVLRVTPAQAVLLITQLQLAMRQPGNVGAGWRVAHDVAEDLIKPFPLSARIALERGFDPTSELPL